MNLKFDLPVKETLILRKYINDEEILYCLPLDMNERQSYCSGYFVITKTRFFVLADEELCGIYIINDFNDYSVVDLTSSGRLEAKKDGEPVYIASFSMEHIGRYYYAQRILNEMASGEVSRVKGDDDEPKCPKCGKRLRRHSRICPYCMSKTGSIKKIMAVAAANRWIYIIILLLFFANTAVMLIQPVVNKGIVDNAILPMSSGEMEAGFSGILFYIILIALCSLAGAVVNILRMGFSSVAGSSLARDLKERIYNKVQDLSIGYVEEQTVGYIMNRISRDTDRVRDFVQNIAVQAINELCLIVGVTIILFAYNWKMAVLAIIPIPFVLFFSKLMRTRMQRLYHNQFRRMDTLNALLNDVLNGIRVVKAFGQEDRTVERFRSDAALVRNITTRVECLAYTIVPTIKLMMTAGSILITFLGGKLVLGNELSPGEFLQLSTYASYLYARLDWFSLLPKRLSEFANATERIFEISDMDPDIGDTADPVKKEIKGDVEFSHVTFGYKSYNAVLKDVNFNVKSGEMIGLVGHSGAGKSTIINLLMRLYDTDEGTIFIDGVDIKKYSGAFYKSQLGVVLQEVFLFSGTILNNIRYARPDASIDDVIRAAKIANAHDFIVGFPDGYDTLVGERGQRLSGGERQRIAIARAVLTDPRILILDEATASVDTETEQQIQEALERLVKGRTTFAIAHRLSTLQNADRLMVIDEGKLAEFGTHEELMRKKGLYYSLVKAQR